MRISVSGGSPSCAMFVDYENILISLEERARANGSSANVPEVVLKVLARLKEQVEKGGLVPGATDGMRVVVGRAYGDWSGLSDAPSSLALMSIHPVYVLARPGKNSADLELSLEALETLLTREDMDHFLIVGGDRDYIPIVRRIHERGKGVTVAALAETTSGDLREIVGDQGFVPLESIADPLLVPPTLPSPAEDEAEATPLFTRRKREAPPIPMRSDVARHEEDLERTLDLVVKATAGQDPMEIPLVAFYKDHMNDAFVTLNNEERKELVEALRQKGVIDLEIRPGWSGAISNQAGYEMVVLVVTEDHPDVRKRLEAMGGET